MGQFANGRKEPLSVGGDSGLADNPVPARQVGLDHRHELLGRAADRHQALPGEPFVDLGQALMIAFSSRWSRATMAGGVFAGATTAYQPSTSSMKL